MGTGESPLGASRATRLFVGLVTGAAAAILASIAMHHQPGLPSPAWALLLILTACSDSFSMKLPAVHARLTVSESFVFTSIFLFGTAPTVLLVLVDGLIVALWRRQPRKPHHVLFNLAEPIVSVWIASEAFFRVSGLVPLSHAPAELGRFAGPALLVALLYFLTNSALTALGMAFETRASSLAIWRQHFQWLSLNSLVSVSIAGLLVQNPDVFLGSFAMSLPLLAASYMVFRSSIGRVEDAHRHVADLRRLYLSTIEALAIAVDAKDQVTHGHIRRVQQIALRLARALDVKDERTLRAIEAAGLLHDIGKLAIPDHILNKPGRLTPAERERMQMHADAGAQILSAIEFPFPVVPIVRHHHEHWDGSGYPAGLKGEDIPLGARILSVADCFDALTSDRPYRRALTVEQAIAVLRERRGSMYDPAVVDRFIQIHADLFPSDFEIASQPHVLAEIARCSHPVPTTPAADVLADGSGLDANGATGWDRQSDIAERAVVALQAILPASMVAVYVYTPVRDELVPVFAAGGPDAFADTRLPVGRTVSGWAAANRTAVVNGDPSLDLGVTDPAYAKLRSCLAVPLAAGDRLLGVLTVYSEEEQALGERARRVAESLAPYLAVWIDAAASTATRSRNTTSSAIAASVHLPNAAVVSRRPH